LGRVEAGTLRLMEDRQGLKYAIDVNPSDPMAMSVLAKIRRGDISGASFAFAVDAADETWTYPPGQKMPLRTIHRVSALIDISPVTFPAYPQTTANA
jgi:HK97 family phage prohead protease